LVWSRAEWKALMMAGNWASHLAERWERRSVAHWGR